jgi:hypothetical protein
MSDTKGTVKRSRGKSAKQPTLIGDEDSADGFTERVLMSLVMDISQLEETVERVRVQVTTLAREKGIKIPKV